MSTTNTKAFLYEYFEETCKSNVINSVRRMFFQSFDIEPLEWSQGRRLEQHLVGGKGSCILIFFQNKFFLLTAIHVLNNQGINHKENTTNSSPFTILKRKYSKKAVHFIKDMNCFFYPHKYWHISDLIREKIQGTNIESYGEDFILVELFDFYSNFLICNDIFKGKALENLKKNAEKFLPDYYIDINNTQIITESEFNNGLYLDLIFAGYPSEINIIEYPENSNDTIACNNRCIEYGRYFKSDSEYFGYIVSPDGKLWEEINFDGISGGVVSDLAKISNDVKWAGMIVAGSSEMIRFIPAFLILEALHNKDNITPVLIDKGCVL